MHIPPIDLSPLVKILKKEGVDELCTLNNPFSTMNFNNPFSPINLEWRNIIRVLEGELVPQLAKGGDLTNLAPVAQELSKSAFALSMQASQVLSFVPGPIGIVCSIINAIVCFSTGQILPGIMELLGCIPGAKFGLKSASKIGPKIGEEIVSIISKNAELSKYLNNWERLLNKSKLISDDLNFSKITGCIAKIKREIADIEKYYPRATRNMDVLW